MAQQRRGGFKRRKKVDYIAANKIEYVDEEKLEFVCNVEDVREVLKTIRQVHPYEEPAIDIVPLIDENSF